MWGWLKLVVMPLGEPTTMRTLKSLIAVLFSTLLLNACATKVKSIKNDRDINLKPNDGYLMLSVDTSVDLSRITIDGEKTIVLTRSDLRAGSNHILITLPAGNYYFDKIRFYIGLREAYVELERGMWDFQAKPGMISYVGKLKVKSSRWGRNTQYILINNSSQALEYLEQNFANILKSRTIDYQGPGDDNFFKVVSGQYVVKTGGQ